MERATAALTEARVMRYIGDGSESSRYSASASPRRNGRSASRSVRSTQLVRATICFSARFAESVELLSLEFLRERGGELVQVAVHDLIDLVQGEIDAVISDAALRKVVSANAL